MSRRVAGQTTEDGATGARRVEKVSQGQIQPPVAVEGARERHEAAVDAVSRLQKPRKYRNAPIEINGIRFDSQKEGKRYDELRFAARNGVIRDLEVHPRFPLVVHGEDCGVYVGDFAWIDPETGERVVEDVKSAATRKLPTYRLKARLLWAIYGLRIREV